MLERPSSAYDAIPDFGMLYDSIPAYGARPDVSFYVEAAHEARGPVLELGSGTGRITLPIARAGVPITGMDASRQMLLRCKAKLDTEPAAVQARVTLHQADAREFEIRVGAQGRPSQHSATYALVIAPFRVFQHLTTVEEQLRVLGGVRRHLAPGGRLVFDVFNPNFKVLATRDTSEHEDTPELILPDGRAFRRTTRVGAVRWVDQVSAVELIYYVAPKPGAEAVRLVQGFDMRWYTRSELVHLLARSGFQTEAIYGDYGRGALTDESPEMVVCARRD